MKTTPTSAAATIQTILGLFRGGTGASGSGAGCSLTLLGMGLDFAPLVFCDETVRVRFAFINLLF
jgi:hypothetical protein